jgi:cytochrome c553
MRISLAGSLLAAVMIGSPAHAADVAAGKAKAELCVGCHGENGISQLENMPSLAGQPDQFIQWQLVYFRAGTRKNEQMQPIVEQLTNDDIRNLGAYFAQLPPPKAPPDANPDMSKKGAQAAAGLALRLMPHRQLRRHQGGGPRRRPAPGISVEGAARLQIRRAIRRRPGRDGRCRLSPQRGRDRSAGALSGASLTVVPALSRDP